MPPSPRNCFTFIVLSLCATFVPSVASAAPRLGSLYAEVDPLPYFFQGYSVHAGFRPVAAPRLRFGAGLSSARLPESFVAANPANAGWGARLEREVLLHVFYRFGDARSAAFAGTYLTHLSWEYTPPSRAGTARVQHLGAIPTVGFQWFPFEGAGLFIAPWAGVGVNLTRHGEPSVGDETFTEQFWSPLFSLHLGWELGI